MTYPPDLTLGILTDAAGSGLAETLDAIYGQDIAVRAVLVRAVAPSPSISALMAERSARHEGLRFLPAGPSDNRALLHHGLIWAAETDCFYLLPGPGRADLTALAQACRYMQDNPDLSAFYGVAAGGTLQVGRPEELPGLSPLLAAAQPVIRTAVWRTHAEAGRLSPGRWSNLPALLRGGPLVHFPLTFFTPLTGVEDSPADLHTPWYFDQVVADYELMLAAVPAAALPPEMRQILIARAQMAYYRQAFRDAFDRLGDPLLSRHYLARLHGHGEAPADWLRAWDRRMLTGALALTILQQMDGSGAQQLCLSASLPDRDDLLAQLNHHRPGLPTAADAGAQHTLHILRDWPELLTARRTLGLSNRHCVALEDLTAMVRLAPETAE